MQLHEQEFTIPASPGREGLIAHLAGAVSRRLRDGEVPVRFAVTRSDAGPFQCELGLMSGPIPSRSTPPASIFEFRRRPVENTDRFNAVLLVPTGIGSEIGGHAGDATPVA